MQRHSFHPSWKLLAAVLLLPVSSCIIIPLDSFSKPAYPPEILQTLQQTRASRDQVIKALGKPVAIKAGNRYWFYTSSHEFIGIIGGTSSAVLDDYEWVMIEFNPAGQLTRLEYNDDLNGCLDDGICYLAGFLSAQPVISAPQAANARARTFQPHSEECALYLYLEELPWYFGNLPLGFTVDGQVLGRIDQSSYLLLRHATGSVKIDAWQLSINVPCRGGERVYIQASKALDWSWETGQDLAPVSAPVGVAAIAQRKLALPDTPTDEFR